VPIGGFKNLKGLYGPQKYSITRAVEVTHLPHASTCFNMLKLPEYDSLQTLRKNLLIALNNGSEGFGFQ
jgi:E3 ubiquitin-protein ligase HUWE1